MSHWLLTTLAALTSKFPLFVLTQIAAQLRIRKKKNKPEISIFRKKKKKQHGNVLQYIAQVQLLGSPEETLHMSTSKVVLGPKQLSLCHE